MMPINTCVRFRGGPTPPATPEEDPNPGKEIVEHLVARLPGAGVTVKRAADIEFAHEIECEVSGRRYEVVVGYDWTEPLWWDVFYTPSLSWLARLWGQSEVEEMRVLTRAIAAALADLPNIDEVRWSTSLPGYFSAKYTRVPET